MSEGVHIRAIRRHDPADPNGPCLLEIQAFPLPSDQALLNECYEACRSAIHAVLTRHGIVSETCTEIPPGGDTSILQ